MATDFFGTWDCGGIDDVGGGNPWVGGYFGWFDVMKRKVLGYIEGGIAV